MNSYNDYINSHLYEFIYMKSYVYEFKGIFSGMNSYIS